MMAGLTLKKLLFSLVTKVLEKNTVAKVVSTLSWLEKSMNRGDTDKKKVSFFTFKKFFEYQKIHNYFSKRTFIEYIGERYHILYDTSKKYPIIKEVEGDKYIVPKIMYIPAERNLLSTISDAYNVKGLPDNVFTFAEELKRAQKELNGKKLKLPIANTTYEYDENEDESYIIGDDYKINLLEASSGLQSFIPLYLVSRNLSMAITDDEKTLRKNLSVTQSLRMDKEIADLMLGKNVANFNQFQEIEKIRARYYNKCFLNVVEEPEQNLFPSSQWEMLKNILEYNNISEGNKLIMTSHSPYLINYLTLCVKAESVYKTMKENNFKLSNPEYSQTNEIVPMSSTVKANELVVYELDERHGSIKKLENFEGIPSDKNYLNQSLAENNYLFDSLLEIEEEL